MSTPTPETDAACWMPDWEGYRGEIIDSNFARRLEQQRDAARKDAELMAEALDCFQDVGLCKAFRDMADSSLTAHVELLKQENRQA